MYLDDEMWYEENGKTNSSYGVNISEIGDFFS
jgi:hypothetical protein